MRRFVFAVAVAMVLGLSGPVAAKLASLDPQVKAEQLALADRLCAKGDVDGLRELLRGAHLFVQKEVALKLGRLGAESALDELRDLDRQYAWFACKPTGDFGVAVILIENKASSATQKSALLKMATAEMKDMKPPMSVIDAAGRELVRYGGDDVIEALTNVRSYGAQETVIRLQCQKLSRPEAIAHCIAVLEAHQTPQTAEAAQWLLIGFGEDARQPVHDLMERVRQRIASTDPVHTIPKTVLSRCNDILKKIDENQPIEQAPNAAP